MAIIKIRKRQFTHYGTEKQKTQSNGRKLRYIETKLFFCHQLFVENNSFANDYLPYFHGESLNPEFPDEPVPGLVKGDGLPVPPSGGALPVRVEKPDPAPKLPAPAPS